MHPEHDSKPLENNTRNKTEMGTEGAKSREAMEEIS